MKREVNLAMRVIAWLMAFVLLWSMAFPSGIVANAATEDEDPSTAPKETTEQTAPVTTTQLSISLTNCTMVGLDGTAISAPLEAEIGSLLQFRVVPADGCEGGTVVIGSTTIVLDPEDTYSVTVSEGLSIQAASQDVTPPTVGTPARDGSGWMQSASYSVSTEDNVGIASVVITDAAGTETELAKNSDGNYTAAIGANGTYTVLVTDTAGLTAQTEITETMIDTEAPVISKLERQVSGIVKEADYHLEVSDALSGIDRVTIQKGSSDETELTAAEDGSYTFTVDASVSYTIHVYDKAGVEATESVTDTEIDTEKPVISDVRREESGWQKEQATYTFTVTDEKSGVASVQFGLADGELQTVTPGEDGSYCVTVTDNGTYRIVAEDALGFAAEESVTESQIDHTAPEMETPARSTNGWTASAVYTVSPTDSESGIVEVTVADASGNTFPATPAEDGSYSFTLTANGTYTVTATSGTGATTQQTVQEYMTDTSSPVIGDVERTMDGWTTAAVYSFTVSDDLSGVACVTVQIGNDAPITLTETDGKYSFSITTNDTFLVTVTDAAGNDDTASGKEEKVDTTGPVISGLTRQNSGWATEATYTFTVDDTQSGVAEVSVSIGGGAPVALAADNGKYGFRVEENTAFVITAVDALGNSDTLAGNEDHIDLTAPAISTPARTSDAWAQAAEYTFTVSDTQSGVKKVTVTIGSETKTLTEANGVYSFTIASNEAFAITAIDNMGHVSTVAGSEARVDTEAPKIGEVIRREDGWATSATYAFTASDALSGVAEVIVSFGDGSERSVSGEDGKYQFTMAANDTFTIRVKDAAGNMTQASGAETMVDTTKPDIATPARQQESWQKEASYLFTAEDTQSGIQSVTVQFGQDAPQMLTASANGAYTFSVDTNGTYTICVTDVVGNAATYTVTEQYIDTTAPALVAFARAEHGWATSATYSFSVEETQSGLQEVTLALGGEAPQTLEAVDGIYSFTLNANTPFQITAVDALGNLTVYDGIETQIDTTVPAVQGLERQEDGWATSATYVFSVEETQSGVQSVTVTIGSADPVTLTGQDGRYRFTMTTNEPFTITAEDCVGNTGTANGVESYVDTTAPAASELTRSIKGWATDASYTFTVEETQSGIQSVTYRLDDGADRTITAAEDGSYCFHISKNGRYTVTVTDLVGNQSSRSVSEQYIDTTKPAITELTRVESGWATDATYTFRVSDDQSGVDTVSVTIGQAAPVVLTAKDGIYSFIMANDGTFTITAADAVHNTETASGEDILIDIDAPAISAPVRTAPSWSYSAEYTIPVEDLESGVASVTVTPEGGAAVTLNPSTEGLYIYVAEANASYTVTAVDKVGNRSTYVFTEALVDTTAPDITDVCRDPDDWSQSSVYTFSVADAQSGVQRVAVLYQGEEVSLTTSGDGQYSFGSAANGTYTIVATDVVGNERRVQVGETLIDLTAPKIHSVTPQASWHSSENTVLFHITDESLLDSVVVKDASGRVVAVTAEGDDIFKAVIRTNGDYTVTATDRAGNATTQGFTVWHIDTESPSTPALASSASQEWVNTDVTLTAEATDSQSGVVAYWYSTESQVFDAATWSKMTFAEGNGALTLSAEQNSIYYVVAQDEVGRVSEPAQIRVFIDKTAPVGVKAVYSTLDGSGFNCVVDGTYIYNDKISFFAQAKDDASGVVRYEYRVENISKGTYSNWRVITAGEDGFQDLVGSTADCLNAVHFRAYDRAGNCSDEFTIKANGERAYSIIENTPATDSDRSPAPTVSATTVDGTYTGVWTAQDVTISVSGSAAVSGIAYYEYSINHMDPTISDVEWTKAPASSDGSQLVVNTDTNAIYFFRAVTYAGNYSQTASMTVKVQKTAPVARTISKEAATGTNGWHTKYPSYTINEEEQNPYFAPVHYVISYTHDDKTVSEYVYDGDNAPKVKENGIWEITVTAVDAAGNRAAVSASTAQFKVDTTAPYNLRVTKGGTDILSADTNAPIMWDDVVYMSTVLTTGFTIFHNSPVTVKASADGGDSGMAAIFVQVVGDNRPFTQSGPWTEIGESGIQLSPDSKCRVFFKAVDGAGNVTYFSAKSIVMDATAPEATTLEATAENLTDRGMYSGNVTVNYCVIDAAVGQDSARSGLLNVSYRVLRDGVVTQSGQLYPGSATVTSDADGLIDSCSGSFVIDAQKNNSNNIVVELTAVDNAGNSKTTYIRQGVIRIDIDTPTLVGSYDRNTPDATLNGESIFTGSRTLTVVATERNLDTSRSFVRVTDTDTGRVYSGNWDSQGSQHTATVCLTEDGHYKVTATITDTAGNSSSYLVFADGTAAGSSFVIDNTAPVITVSYDNNTVRNGRYFPESRTATIRVVERNFNPANINVSVRFTSESGTVSAVALGEWHHEGNIHWASAVCADSGRYSVAVSGADAVGNTAPLAAFTGSVPYDFTVDTHIDAPVFTGVKDGSAYSGSVVPGVTASDTNLDTLTIQILRTQRNEIRKDVTEEMMGTGSVENLESGKETLLDVFAQTAEMDGIYTIVATSKDMAGNTATSEVTFSVNRFGSVYVYGSVLQESIGSTMRTLPGDLTVTEYNASGLVAGSARVYITRDGIPLTDPIFEVTPAVDGKAEPGGSGWYEYQYVISKDNFTQDGQYVVVISTEDYAGNLPENTSDDNAIRFAIDTTAPELTSVHGMEEKINKADSLTVTFTASDNVLLDSVVVYIDGRETARWEDIGQFQFEQEFTITEGLDRHVRIVVTDVAGNVLDTDEESFAPGYAFQDTITVSSNFFLRFYANKPLFWGSILATAGLLALILFLVFIKKQKEDEETASSTQ